MTMVCFIATAAYGSPLADEVQFLRRYRESVVKRNKWGRCLVTAFEKFYYTFSPTLARLIEGSEKLCYLARIFVADPIVDTLLVGSFAFSSGRKRLADLQAAHDRLIAGILMRGIGGLLYCISWVVWNSMLVYLFLRPEITPWALLIWVPMMSGLVLTRIGAWVHKEIDFTKVVPI